MKIIKRQKMEHRKYIVFENLKNFFFYSDVDYHKLFGNSSTYFLSHILVKIKYMLKHDFWFENIAIRMHWCNYTKQCG